MNINDLADEVMAYLDSVGVAAEYELFASNVLVTTDKYEFRVFNTKTIDPLVRVKKAYPQKARN